MRRAGTTVRVPHRPAVPCIASDSAQILALSRTGALQALLEEYEACGDFDETVGCLRTLDAPHYHHELTKRALLAAFEKPDQAPALLALLRRLADTGVVSQVHAYTMCIPQDVELMHSSVAITRGSTTRD